MTEEKTEKTDEGGAVGYGRPPLETRFKKGQSGNPQGRPRRSNTLRAIAARVLGEIQRLPNRSKGGRVLYSTLEVIIMALKQRAASGDPRAAALFTKISEDHGRQNPPPRGAGYLVIPERLTEAEWEAKHMPKEPLPGDVDKFD